MTNPVVVYTDPAWAKSKNGETDPTRATIEREMFGDTVTIRLATARNGVYPLDGETLEEIVQGADAIVIYRVHVNDALLDAAGDRLKVVARQGVGTDNLNVPLLRSRGIMGFNVPDYCVDEVAAHTVGLILAAERGIVAQHISLTGGLFDIHHGGTPRRLTECVAGVVGFGRVGRVVAIRLKQFYGKVIACDPEVSADQMAAYGVELVSMDDLLRLSDVVTLHCPLDDTTRGMFSAKTFNAMKPDAIFANAARGALVDAKALLLALENRLIGGAVLDVFSPEDPNMCNQYRRVLKLPNVIVTSHRAFLSSQAEVSQRWRVAKGVRETLLNGSLSSISRLA